MVQAAGRLPSLNGDAIRYPAHAGSAAWMKAWPVRSSATPRDGDLRFGRVHRVSLSPRSCSWRRGLVGRMPSRARTGDRADGELPLQDSNLDYLIQSAGPRATKTDKLTGNGVPTSIGALSV